MRSLSKIETSRGSLSHPHPTPILDTTDHRLVQAFFDLNPKKGQVSKQ